MEPAFEGFNTTRPFSCKYIHLCCLQFLSSLTPCSGQKQKNHDRSLHSGTAINLLDCVMLLADGDANSLYEDSPQSQKTYHLSQFSQCQCLSSHKLIHQHKIQADIIPSLRSGLQTAKYNLSFLTVSNGVSYPLFS